MPRRGMQLAQMRKSKWHRENHDLCDSSERRACAHARRPSASQGKVDRKVGSLEDIAHTAFNEVGGPPYGHVVRYLCRARPDLDAFRL